MFATFSNSALFGEFAQVREGLALRLGRRQIRRWRRQIGRYPEEVQSVFPGGFRRVRIEKDHDTDRSPRVRVKLVSSYQSGNKTDDDDGGSDQ